MNNSPSSSFPRLAPTPEARDSQVSKWVGLSIEKHRLRRQFFAFQPPTMKNHTRGIHGRRAANQPYKQKFYWFYSRSFLKLATVPFFCQSFTGKLSFSAYTPAQIHTPGHADRFHQSHNRKSFISY